MPVADLLEQLAPSSLPQDERDVTGDWVRRRVRALIAADATIKDPKNAKDITAAATPDVFTKLQAELDDVRAAYKTIWGRVKADTAHLPLDLATINKTVSLDKRFATPPALRPRMVRCIVYQAIAADLSLAKPANIERLHMLCDRRLRVAEQMLYRVGAGHDRDWNRTAIAADPGGEWRDGTMRMFEYPRVFQQPFFLAVCKPGAEGVCTAPMSDWTRIGATHLLLRHAGRPLNAVVRANSSAVEAWPENPDDSYELDYKPGALGNAVDAINALFTPKTDYKQRNLFFCDHTIHSLHLEALVFSRSKRGQAPAWLETERTHEKSDWLRIYSPMAAKSMNFLASIGSSAHFALDETVHPGDVQIGDHLIVYNHPAYNGATATGVWRLENAVVVETVPTLLMQGHGSPIYDLATAKKIMLGLFNSEVGRRRSDVIWQAPILARGDNPDGSSWIGLEASQRVYVGMHIDIVKASDGSVVSAKCPVAKVENTRGAAGWYKKVTHVGMPIPAGAPASLMVRHARETLGSFTVITSPDGPQVVQRVPPAASAYKGVHKRADWHLVWHAVLDELVAALDAPRAALIKQKQYIDYHAADFDGSTKLYGWFPLWRPTLKKDGTPYTSAGKIVATEANVIGPEAISGWTWLLMHDPSVPPTKPQKALDAELYNVPVLRPTEP